MGGVYRGRDFRLGPARLRSRSFPTTWPQTRRPSTASSVKARAIASITHPSIPLHSRLRIGCRGAFHGDRTAGRSDLAAPVWRAVHPLAQAILIAADIADGLSSRMPRESSTATSSRRTSSNLGRPGQDSRFRPGLRGAHGLGAEDEETPTTALEGATGAIMGTIGYMAPNSSGVSRWT